MLLFLKWEKATSKKMHMPVSSSPSCKWKRGACTHGNTKMKCLGGWAKEMGLFMGTAVKKGLISQ